MLNLSSFKSDDFFSVILLPDTQYYSSKFPDIFYKQMDWIIENRNQLNIQYVVHLGDLTNNNKEYAWKVADKSFRMLDDTGIPYSIVYGDNDMKNPDENYYDGIRHTELLNKYFPPSRLEKNNSWWNGGFFEPDKIDNYYCLFNYKDHKFMIMNLELAARDNVLAWADSIISANPSRKVIIVTHDYLDKKGKRLDDLKSFGMDGKDDMGNPKGNNAETVFKKLVKQNPNVILVLCGHKSGEFEKIVKIKESKDSENTRKVFEILSDFQDEKTKGSNERSGKGLLRVIKFYPENNEIAVFTVSALTGKSKEKKVHLFF